MVMEGTWWAHSVEHATLGLRVTSSSPMVDVELPYRRKNN